MPARIPGGLPANFQGIPKGGDQMAGYITDRAGGVPFSPVGHGLGSLRLDNVTAFLRKGMWGFLGLSSFDGGGQANKFSLRGMVNFTGDYPADLVAARQKKT
jgi:hypothetical protein